MELKTIKAHICVDFKEDNFLSISYNGDYGVIIFGNGDIYSSIEISKEKLIELKKHFKDLEI